MAIKLQSAGWRRQIPQSPGVYFFSAKDGKTIYIGKAANLRARLQSRVLPKETKSVTWEVLGSEAEALIREAELIKKYRPKYNILMRDDKQYFYVGFTSEPYPKVFITHQKNKKANYIGPFTEGGALRNVLRTIRRAFPYCTCKRPHKRLCLNALIGRCLGYCCLKDQSKLTQSLRSFSPRQRVAPRVAWTFRSSLRSETVPKSPQNPLSDSSSRSAPHLLTKERELGGEVYTKNISSIKQILSGKNRVLARELKKEMHKLSDARRYEKAGKLRDQIRALEKIFGHREVIKQDLPTEFTKALRALESLLKIGETNRIEAYDIANIHGKFAYGSMAVFANGELQKKDYRLFKIRGVQSSNDPAMLKEVLERRLKHQEWPYPDMIIVDGGKTQFGAALAAWPPSKIIALTKNQKHVGDHIFISGRHAPIALAKLPSSLKNLILHLDSEAHRFAISHYRKLHRQSLTSLPTHANLNK